MAKRGPKPKLTPKAKRTLIGLLRVGMSLADSLLALGVSRRSYDRAREEDEKFATGVKSAACRGKARHLQRVARGDERWQSSAWFLERKYGAEFGNRLKLDVEGEYTMRLVEEIVEVPAGEASKNHHANGAAAQGAAGLSPR